MPKSYKIVHFYIILYIIVFSFVCRMRCRQEGVATIHKIAGGAAVASIIKDIIVGHRYRKRRICLFLVRYIFLIGSFETFCDIAFFASYESLRLCVYPAMIRIQ